jgi:hypothetical protein
LVARLPIRASACLSCAPVLLFVHRSFLGDHPISAWPQFADQTARGQDCVTFQDAIINGRIECSKDDVHVKTGELLISIRDRDQVWWQKSFSQTNDWSDIKAEVNRNVPSNRFVPTMEMFYGK